MLIDIETGRPIDSMPYYKEFESLRARLSEEEFDAIIAHIDALIESAGGEVATAGWLPGKDWTGSPLEAIYTKAARRDHARSALFFGQLVWHAIMQRPEAWGSGRYEKNGRDIGSRTYFRIER